MRLLPDCVSIVCYSTDPVDAVATSDGRLLCSRIIIGNEVNAKTPAVQTTKIVLGGVIVINRGVVDVSEEDTLWRIGSGKVQGTEVQLRTMVRWAKLPL